MADWHSGDIVANGIKLHYYRTGGHKPPLVLSHGITDNGLCWTRVARVLEADYDVVMVDARGHGLSDAPETGYDPDDRVADLAGFIRALGLRKPYLMGHSVGADTTALTAVSYPDLAGCAILEDPPWHEGVLLEEHRQATIQGWRTTILERKSKTPDDLLAITRGLHPEWDESELGPWVQAKQQVSLNVLQTVAGLRPDWRAIATRMACPTLLITGDPSLGALVTSEVAAEVSRLCPQIKVSHVGGAGHSIRRERFASYMAAVTGFLAGIGSNKS
jgi:N-formylmaleamate deformylase